MITHSQIIDLGWEQINSLPAYILYGSTIDDDNSDFSTMILTDNENWMIKYKTISTYYGKVADSSELQTIMTDFDIP